MILDVPQTLPHIVRDYADQRLQELEVLVRVECHVFFGNVPNFSVENGSHVSVRTGTRYQLDQANTGVPVPAEHDNLEHADQNFLRDQLERVVVVDDGYLQDVVQDLQRFEAVLFGTFGRSREERVYYFIQRKFRQARFVEDFRNGRIRRGEKRQVLHYHVFDGPLDEGVGVVI